MKKIDWYRIGYKDWVGLSAAPVFWVASLICFVLGLSFKTGTGIMIPGTTMDIIALFSVGLGLANTAIQIVGNDTDKEELGMPMYLMWMASYALGIGSNVNFLDGVIGLNSKLLQFAVCWGLGIMIEVAPERLLVKFLQSAGVLTGPTRKPQVQQSQQQPRQEPRNEPKADYGYGGQSTAQQRLPQQGKQAPRPQNQPRPQGEHPNYHPVTYQGQELPEFLQKRKMEN